MRLIDADKTAEVLTKLLYETALNNSGEASMMCEDIAEHRLKTWVDLVPTEAEPIRHGRWINISISASRESLAECDLCGAIVHNNFSNIINYCPNCGAKMDERREDESSKNNTVYML